MDRVNKIRMHLCSAKSIDDASNADDDDDHSLPNMKNADEVWNSSNQTKKYFSVLERDIPSEGEYNVADHLAGPLHDKERYPNGWIDAFKELNKSARDGRIHVKLAEWQQEYTGSLGGNIVIPYLIFKREGGGDEGARAPPVISQEVIIGDPEDARRIARVHVKKQPNFNLFFYGSVISTVDNEYWRMQREQLVPGFLPQASLRQIFDISAERAQFCADRMHAKLAEADKNGTFVDMNEFLLFETQAQLQLALFGETPEFMNDTNEKFRHAMGGSYDPRYVRPFCKALADRMERDDRHGPALLDDVKAGRCPAAKGPLSYTLKHMEGVAPKTREGNSLIFAFAGHDTTGHTMTWLLLELAKNPHLQDRLQAEVDQFFKDLDGKQPVYDDLLKLPFMTKCIMETLRLWPAVANGTFREIQFDDYVKGPDGKDVLLKQGQYVRIVNWSRHRNPDLWGPDVNQFNPDRQWKDEEIWNGNVLRAYNPASERFSPFTFPPRGCIGMNFAHLEARLIIAHLLHNFTFDLTPEFVKHMDPTKYLGINYGTMGPGASPLPNPPKTKGLAGWAPAVKVPTGMPMKITPRK